VTFLKNLARCTLQATDLIYMTPWYTKLLRYGENLIEEARGQMVLPAGIDRGKIDN
jgi:hypothetical protein